jgi:endonuclease/exonuclease/phosphatase family metal-dependent hydrolase
MSWNVHKGFDALGRRVPSVKLSHALRSMPWDVCFLQEVPGQLLEALSHANDLSYSYGFTRTVGGIHYGNAILSKYGKLSTLMNHDISASVLESRRMLAANWNHGGLDCLLVSTHFGLFPKWRDRQADDVMVRVDSLPGSDGPVVMGGDFNDHTHLIGRKMALKGFDQLSKTVGGHSFPAVFPLVTLDYIYGKNVMDYRPSNSKGLLKWAEYSDHCPVFACADIRKESN